MSYQSKRERLQDRLLLEVNACQEYGKVAVDQANFMQAIAGALDAESDLDQCANITRDLASKTQEYVNSLRRLCCLMEDYHREITK